jgi:hypothetical protein
MLAGALVQVLSQLSFSSPPRQLNRAVPVGAAGPKLRLDLTTEGPTVRNSIYFWCRDRPISHTLSVIPALCWFPSLAYFSTLKMEATCSSETSVNFQHISRRYISEDRTLHNHWCGNLNFYLGTIHISVRRHSIHISASRSSSQLCLSVCHSMICYPGLSFCEIFVTFHYKFVFVEPCLLQ